jgi:hypothetical protein
MDTIRFLFWNYVELLTSWWWLSLAAFTVIAAIVFVLKDDDRTLTIGKAVQLALVGLIDTIPLVRRALPNLAVLDFFTRWAVLGMGPFWAFVVTFAFHSLIFGPAFSLFVFGGRFWDELEESTLASDVRRQGLGRTIKRYLGGA